jgi:hypothetical protein
MYDANVRQRMNACVQGHDTVPHYTNVMLHGRLLMQLFRFAKNHRGLYHNSVPGAAKFYPSSSDEVCCRNVIDGI